MKKVIETVTNLQLRGTPVSAAVIRPVARGVIIANDRSFYWRMTLTLTSARIACIKFCIAFKSLVEQ